MRLTFEEFKELCVEISNNIHNEYEERLSLIDNNILSIEWRLYAEYADCYGSRGTAGEEQEPKFLVIDTILNKICRNISYLQFRALEDLMHKDTVDRSDYYSHISNNRRYIKLRDFYNYLVEENLIDGEVVEEIESDI